MTLPKETSIIRKKSVGRNGGEEKERGNVFGMKRMENRWDCWL